MGTAGFYLFGVPQLENVPRLSEIPVATYSWIAASLMATYRSVSSAPLLARLAFDPRQHGWDYVFSLATSGFVHRDWSHFAGSVVFLAVFAPLVEHELGIARFLLLLFSAVAAGDLAQAALGPHVVMGFGGAVTAVLAFFCFRFPTAVVCLVTGEELWRFAAPMSLVLYLGMDVQATLGVLLGWSASSGWMHLGGAFVGMVCHLVAGEGRSTREMRKLAQQGK
jgi:membrane associated rhomboid family serine protease